MELQIEQWKAIWQDNSLDDMDYILLILHNENHDFNNRLCMAFNAKVGNKRKVIIEGQEAYDLLALYTIYAFTDKLIIGSLSLPHGRKLNNLLQCGIATEDELINDIILGGVKWN
ncbi:MAG: hypothetical protein FWC91_04730 [Defluviitaleaceae bacterium]|nr:hypothetical protein [Defluviitaleaceae bacterium]